MAPGKADIFIRRGDPWELIFSSELDGVPEPIVAADILAQIRDTPDGTILVDLAINAVVDVTGFIATLSLDATETALLIPGCYVWDLQPDVDGDTWLEGKADISPDVSRPIAP